MSSAFCGNPAPRRRSRRHRPRRQPSWRKGAAITAAATEAVWSRPTFLFCHPSAEDTAMSAPSLPMQFGVPLSQLSFLFFGCLGVAIWLVYAFCQKRFAERSVTESSDWIYQLLPRQLATREEYSKGFLIYFGTLAALVVL